jgi:hypothetical protein
MFVSRHSTVALALCALLISPNVLSAEIWHSSTTKMVYPQADGTFVLIFDTDAPACTGPGPGKYHYVSPTQYGMTEEGAKKLYAAALAALAADKTVQIAFDNSTSFCYVNRLTIAR